MKHIGFIDYYLDEWHANNYPSMIGKNCKLNGRNIDVSYAWAQKNKENGLHTAKWCEKYGVQALASIDELVEKSDYIIVLSPDNPEYHESLARIPLMSGKPVYVDKTFADSYKSAFSMFELAGKHNTPLFSSSALRFSEELSGYPDNIFNQESLKLVHVTGPGEYSNYAVHQIEMIVSLLGTKARRIKSLSSNDYRHLIVDFTCGRRALMTQMKRMPFQAAMQSENGDSVFIKECTGFFPRFIDSMLDFFETGISPVPKEETLEVIAIIEGGANSLKKNDTWINL